VEVTIMSTTLKAKKKVVKIPSKFQKGKFLWWTRHGAHSGDRYNCPCVVKSVSEKGFKVFSFNDGRTSALIPFDSDAAQEELKEITKREVRDYISSNSTALLEKEDGLLREIGGVRVSLAMLEDASAKYLK
jgi:predicted metal-binding protein